jgi:hypothetical protein
LIILYSFLSVSIFREVTFVWRSIQETSVNRNAHKNTRTLSRILTNIVQKATFVFKIFQRAENSVLLAHDDSFVPGASVGDGIELLGSSSTENQGLDIIYPASDEGDQENQASLLLQRHIERLSFSELLSGCGRFLSLGAPGY